MVLPVGDANPTRRKPVLTILFIAINIAVFVVLQPHEGCAEASFLFRWAAIPRELLSLRPLDPAALEGVIGSCASAVGAKSVLASALTAMFLHANLLHLGGNMLFLWVFGNNVEDRLGHARFALFYLAGGLAATYVFAFINAGSSQPLLGASGAVAAVLGAYLLLYPRARVFVYAPFPLYLLAIFPGIKMRAFFLIFAIVAMPAWLVLGMWFILQLVSSNAPAAGEGVAYAAHVAGFVAGMALLLVLDTRNKRRSQPGLRPSY